MSKGLLFGAGVLLLAGAAGGTLAVRNGWLGPTPAAAAPSTTRPAGSPSTPAAARPPVEKKPAPLPDVFSRLSPQERGALKLAGQVKWLRGRLDAWKRRHDGRSPDFDGSPMWQQLLTRDGKHPPLLKSAPVNGVNNFFRVLAVRNQVNAGDEVRVAGIGWVYCVRTGKLWGTDADGKVFDDAAVDVASLKSRLVFDLPPREQEARLLVTLSHLRAQVRKYQNEHKGRAPSFGKYPAFEQLLKVTGPDGTILPFSPSPNLCGPYLAALPVNPLNGGYKAAAVAGPIRPGQKAPEHCGYVFGTSRSELFAVDRNGRVLDDAEVARGLGALAAEALESLRGHLAHYRREHADKAPDLKRYPNWRQLTGKTRADGVPDPAGKFGPYLSKPPVNPRNAFSAVEVIDRMPPAGGYKPRTKAGWVYESATGQVWMTDEAGALVAD